MNDRNPPDLGSSDLPTAENAGGRLTIDLSAIANNYQFLAKKSAGAETGAAVKANAYGTGLKPVVDILAKNGCRNFFTALPQEGIALREFNRSATIFVLGGVSTNSINHFNDYNLTPVLSSLEDVTAWTGGAGDRPFALHVDTGMNRLGISFDEAKALAELKPEVVMSHFACADDPAHPLNSKQLSAFNNVRKLFPDARASLANSAAILSGSDCRFDITRPGIALYGGAAINDIPNPMRPVVRLEGRILQIRDIPSGDGIGYGRTHIFGSDARVATVSVGYADGYMRAASGSGTPLRSASNGGYGIIAGHKVPIVGRISMDLTAFDITDVPQGSARQGDWITLLDDQITVDDLAKCAGTIGYEILTSLGRRFARTYING